MPSFENEVQCYIFDPDYTIHFFIVLTPSVKTLIFDLGGVILDLSVDHTLQSFSALSGIEKQRVKQIFLNSPEFNHYEKGELEDHEFRTFIRKAYQVTASNTDIDICWNAMLRGIPTKKLEMLDRLREQYNVFLLSNTNEIHLNYINQTILPSITGGNQLDIYFHRAYYSHRMKKRKPDAAIFQQVLDENKLAPAETLFLDDNALNIEGASSVGIQTIYVTTPELVLDVFSVK
jgi:epoxide hydrolase-like predicted phosphatase